MKDMVASAKAGDFDLLLAGYSDRWQRNVRRTLEVLEDTSRCTRPGSRW